MNNKIIIKISKIVGIVGIAVSVILGILFYLSLNNEAALSSNISLMMLWTLIVIILVVIVAFIYGPIVSLFSNPKSLKKALLSLGVLVVIFFISLLISSKDTSSINLSYEIKGLEQQVFWTDLGMKMMYITSGLTILAIIYAEIKNLLKL